MADIRRISPAFSLEETTRERGREKERIRRDRLTGNVSSVVGTPTVGQLTLLAVARGQVFLVQLGIVLFRLRLFDRAALELGRLERAELELVVKVERRRAVLVIRFPRSAQVKFLAAERVGVQSVGFRTLERFLLVRVQLFVRITLFRFVRLAARCRCGRWSSRSAAAAASLLMCLHWLDQDEKK